LSRRIVINATHVRSRINGIGTYTLELLRHWRTLPSALEFDVFLHEAAKVHFADLKFPDKFKLHWVSGRWFPENANLRRFVYSNLLGGTRGGNVVFHASQLEMSLVGVRQIAVVHDLIPLESNAEHQKLQHFFFKHLVPIGIANAAAVVTGSRATLDALQNRYGVAPEKVRIIPYGVRTFNGNGSAHRAHDGRKFILFAGRMSPYRNVDRLVQAFRKIKDRVDHNLVLAGEVEPGHPPPQGDDRVTVLGYVSNDQLAGLYRSASAFVFPSLQEGFGLTPVEAMSCGCPVVVSRVSSMPEACGDAAVYIDPLSVDSIADGLMQVLGDQTVSTRLIAAGYRRAKELTWEACAERHLRLFEEVSQA